MENNVPYYVTYRFFDEKGRRLAIFAIPGMKAGLYKIDDKDAFYPNILHVYVIACSKKDSFSKARAKEMFSEFIENQCSTSHFI